MKKKIIIILFSIICISLNVSFASAEWAYGYAVYRDGAFLGTTWHAGLLKNSYMNSDNHSYKPIVHIGGLNQGVTTCNKDVFLNNNNFMGYYRPTSSLSNSKKSDIVATATSLVNYDIGYNATRQLGYNAFSAGDIIDPHEITLIRCDGVVEYSYEYNGVRIFGVGSDWNISLNNAIVQELHTINIITPKKQALQYMINTLGDVDSDCDIDIDDARLAQRIAIELEDPNEYQKYVADVDGSGVIDMIDARYILRYAIELENTFPAMPN